MDKNEVFVNIYLRDIFDFFEGIVFCVIVVFYIYIVLLS